MKATVYKMELSIDGVDMVAEFSIHGKYYPATRECPAEYPEIEILSVKVIDSEIDIFELLSDKQIENIESQIYENFEL